MPTFEVLQSVVLKICTRVEMKNNRSTQTQHKLYLLNNNKYLMDKHNYC